MAEDYGIFIPDCLKVRLSRKGASVKFLEKREGVIVFSDISGFTSLTEKLMLTGREGSEELTFLINKYFDRMIKVISLHGGDIIKFGGDALLCYFKGPQGRVKALQAVGKMMSIVKREYVNVPTSAGKFTIYMHCGVSLGEFWECAVGEEYHQLEYLLFGEPIVQALHLADCVLAGEIGLDKELQSILTDHFKSDCSAEQDFIRIKNLRGKSVVGSRAKVLPVDTFTGLHIQHFIPKSIRDYLHKTDYIGEHRRVGICFIELTSALAILMQIRERMKDEKEVAHYFIEILSRIYHAIAGTVEYYGGTYLKTDTSGKGEKIIFLFGAPVAHEDDERRALEATYRVVEQLKQVHKVFKEEMKTDKDLFAIKCGLNAGNVFWTLVGNEVRREWTVMGDSVNLSARLMSISKNWAVTVQGKLMNQLTDYEWEYVGCYKIKGKQKSLDIYTYAGDKTESKVSVSKQELIIGREGELAILERCADKVSQGSKQLVSISADAGMGKTLLCDNFIKKCRERDVNLYMVTCQAYVMGEPYYGWKQLSKQIFASNAVDGNKPNEVERFLKQNVGEFKKWIPVINDLLETTIKENELTERLEPRTRKNKLFELLSRLLVKLSIAKPVVIICDDAHWMDGGSLEFIEYLFSSPVHLQAMIVLSNRKELDVDCFRKFDSFVEIALHKFKEAESYRLMDSIMGMDEKLSDLKQTISTKAQGNPLFIKLLSENLISQTGVSSKDLTVPDTISSMFLSIIDQLVDEQKLFLKLASIIGKTFNADDMATIFSKELQSIQVNFVVDILKKNDWLLKESDNQYSFKYPLMQEVAYESMPYSYKRTYHARIASYFENKTRDPHKIIEYLAFHYFRSSNAIKAIEHLLTAADKSQRLYILNQSNQYYSDIMELVEKIKQKRYSDYFFEQIPARDILKEFEFNALAKWGKVLSQMGRMKNAIEKFNNAIKRGKHHADVNELIMLKNKMAHSYFVVGQLKIASKLAQSSLSEAKRLNYFEGIAGSYNILINLQYMQKDFKCALRFAKHAISYAKKTSSPALLADIYSNTGIIYWSMNRISDAICYAKKSLNIREKIKDKYGIATSYNNIGVCYFHKRNYKKALLYYKKSLKLHEYLDDLYGTAWSHNNIGEILFESGKLNDAFKHFKYSNTLAIEYGDKSLEAITHLFLSSIFFRKREQEKGLEHFNIAVETASKLNQNEELMIAYYWIVHYFISVDQMHASCDYYEKLKDILSLLDKEAFYYLLYSHRIKDLDLCHCEFAGGKRNNP
ncbi:MAG: hypothetical protein A2Y62_12815 [Candidatus Fischerbacteria bacterium RBG_13_37_8]|uniref:Guanylate cyclase domain-containing protein n=1 Tax=Candidatus Fischerbacteria bacterium RBG_13_37_8 TaxID=1817863 RepID=A0A1F5VQF2_9BACT|nr:MAG: hypothetical protein A2Y62_12815 [Candidatus Fischerbacteria bacterium RBG_13_37_8]